MAFESSLRLVTQRWQDEQATAQERFETDYQRVGDAQVVRTRIDSLTFTQRVRPDGPGRAEVQLTLSPGQGVDIMGAFFHLCLPASAYAGAKVELIEPQAMTLDRVLPAHPQARLQGSARGLRLLGTRDTLEVRSDSTLTYLLTTDPVSGETGLYSLLASGKVSTLRHHRFTLQARAAPDTGLARIQVFPSYPGAPFLGIGGNFRLQMPKVDALVIDYCLENLPVRMGRVELPWRHWHRQDSVDPLAAARRGDLHPRVRAAMEMAQRLDRLGMPVLLAAWFPPAWAVEAPLSRGRNPDGTYGNPLRPDRMAEVYASLAGYIQHLQEAYGVEIALFSFNESDLGINVRQTAAEHAALIAGLGAELRARGLKTKLLLGDTADANGFPFVEAALADPATWPYIGAVSFHSWRGWDQATLLEWREVADRLDIPLIVGEGSIDAAAWRYPAIFEEAAYAREEIKLYLRILAICQPQAILQWQLTADYSPLAGGGVYGNDSTPLRPTLRFWHLRQLGSTPPGLAALPLTCDHPGLYAAALGDGRHFALHLLNDGASREVVVTGIPPRVRSLSVLVTSPTHEMETQETVEVQHGLARFWVPATALVSLMTR